MAFSRQGAAKADILAGLHEAVSARAVALLKRVGVAERFVITGGIAQNIGVVTKIRDKLDGMQITLPAEPMIAGAVGAALFAYDRARRKAPAVPSHVTSSHAAAV